MAGETNGGEPTDGAHGAAPLGLEFLGDATRELITQYNEAKLAMQSLPVALQDRREFLIRDRQLHLAYIAKITVEIDEINSVLGETNQSERPTGPGEGKKYNPELIHWQQAPETKEQVAIIRAQEIKSAESAYLGRKPMGLAERLIKGLKYELSPVAGVGRNPDFDFRPYVYTEDETVKGIRADKAQELLVLLQDNSISLFDVGSTTIRVFEYLCDRLISAERSSRS